VGVSTWETIGHLSSLPGSTVKAHVGEGAEAVRWEPACPLAAQHLAPGCSHAKTAGLGEALAAGTAGLAALAGVAAAGKSQGQRTLALAREEGQGLAAVWAERA